MDDPMIRSRLGRITGTRPFGALDTKPGPLFFLHPLAARWLPSSRFKF
jgi:hypothetical protein